MGSLTALDIIVLLLVGLGAIRGLMNGLVTEVLGLGAWVAAVFAVRLFHAPAAEALTGSVGTPAGAAILAFVAVFGLTFLVGKLVAGRVGSVTRSSVIGPFDRVLGAGFGIVKGVLIATVGFMLVTLVYDKVYGERTERPRWMQDSHSFPALNATSAALSDLIDERRDAKARERAVADAAATP